MSSVLTLRYRAREYFLINSSDPLLASNNTPYDRL